MLSACCGEAARPAPATRVAGSRRGQRRALRASAAATALPETLEPEGDVRDPWPSRVSLSAHRGSFLEVPTYLESKAINRVDAL